MTHAVIKNPDNSVAVVHLSPEAIAAYAARGLNPGQMAEEEVNKLKSRGDLQPACELKAKNIELPPDREFRGAWSWLNDSPVIDIDAAKAVEITKTRLRSERVPELEKLDVEYIRASEAQDRTKMDEIAVKKQALRDITATVPTPTEALAGEEFLAELRAIKVKKA